MSDDVLKLIVSVMFVLWLVLVLPGWVFGMFYAGRFSLLPEGPMTSELWALTAAFYLPPILTAVAVYRIRKSKKNA